MASNIDDKTRLKTLYTDPIVQKTQDGQRPTRPFYQWMEAVNESLIDLLFGTQIVLDLTGDVDDLDFQDADVIRLDNDATLTITGLVASRSGQRVLIMSVGGGQVNFERLSPSSTDVYRIETGVIGRLSLAPGVGFVQFWYDGVDNVWRPLIFEQGASIEEPPVTAGPTVTGQVTAFNTLPTAQQRTPHVSYDSTHDIYLVLHGSQTDVGGIFVDAHGAGLGAGFAIDTDHATFKGLPHAAYSPDADVFLVAWVDARNGSTEIWGRLLRYTASGPVFLATDFLISATLASGSKGPAVVYSPTQELFLVVYNALDTDIRATHYDTSGAAVGSELVLISEAAPAFQGEPDACWNEADDEFLVVWFHTPDSVATNDGAIYGQRINAANQTFVGLTLAITSDSLPRWAPRVIYRPGVSLYLVIYYEETAPPGAIKQRLLHADGTRVAFVPDALVPAWGALDNLDLRYNPVSDSALMVSVTPTGKDVQAVEVTFDHNDIPTASAVFVVIPAGTASLGHFLPRCVGSTADPLWLVVATRDREQIVGALAQAGALGPSPTTPTAGPAVTTIRGGLYGFYLRGGVLHVSMQLSTSTSGSPQTLQLFVPNEYIVARPQTAQGLGVIGGTAFHTVLAAPAGSAVLTVARFDGQPFPDATALDLAGNIQLEIATPGGGPVSALNPIGPGYLGPTGGGGGGGGGGGSGGGGGGGGGGGTNASGRSQLLLNGQPLDWIGVSAFTLFRLWLAGDLASVNTLLSHAKAKGYQLVRVFSMLTFDPFWTSRGEDFDPYHAVAGSPSNYYTQWGLFADHVRSFGLAVECVLLADLDDPQGLNTQARIEQHLDDMAAALTPKQNLVYTLGNEPPVESSRWAGQWDSFGQRFLNQMPAGTLLAGGAESSGPSGLLTYNHNPFNYLVWHGNRTSGWTWVTRYLTTPPVTQSQRYPVENEPMNAGATGPSAGQGDDDEGKFFALACLARLMQFGVTFHFHDGLSALVPSGHSAVIETEFLKGLAAVSHTFGGTLFRETDSRSPFDVSGPSEPTAIVGRVDASGTFVALAIEVPSGWAPTFVSGAQATRTTRVTDAVLVEGTTSGTGGPSGPSGAPPNRLAVVQQVATAHPDWLLNSCQAQGGTWQFLDEVVRVLRLESPKWGYNGKRGTNVISEDVVTYQWGPGVNDVFIIDVITGHCGATPMPSWQDQTAATAAAGTVGKFIYPRV